MEIIINRKLIVGKMYVYAVAKRIIYSRLANNPYPVPARLRGFGGFGASAEFPGMSSSGCCAAGIGIDKIIDGAGGSKAGWRA